jgi:hypothetical protein
VRENRRQNQSAAGQRQRVTMNVSQEQVTVRARSPSVGRRCCVSPSGTLPPQASRGSCEQTRKGEGSSMWVARGKAGANLCGLTVPEGVRGVAR